MVLWWTSASFVVDSGPDIQVFVDDEMDESPGRVTVSVQLPDLPQSVEQDARTT